MAYTSLTAAQIEDLSGINISILGNTAPELVTLIDTLRGYAEAEVGVRLGGVLADLTLTAPQVLLTQQAVAYITARRYLVNPKVKVLTGTHEPLLMEDSAAFDEVIADLKTWSDDLIASLAEVLSGGTAELGDVETGTMLIDSPSPYSTYLADLAASV